MASSVATTPDTLINLKINHDGITKKLKLPLRDLGASTLEDKVCLPFLCTAICVIHRLGTDTCVECPQLGDLAFMRRSNQS